MREIDITAFVTDLDTDPSEFSASQMERGKNAGPETWQNAMARALVPPPLLASADDLEAFRDHMKGFGAWDDDEIAAWSDQECNALFIQLISGDLREMGFQPDDFDWEAYEADGNAAHNIFKGDDDEIYYYLGD